MARPVRRLVFVTPFDRGIVEMSEADQLVLLKGCVLCQITRDLSNGSTRSKPEWKTCKAEIGVPMEVLTIDEASAAMQDAIGRRAPAVCAETAEGALIPLFDEAALARCKGSVSDFRGRLSFRLASLDLALPE